MRRMSTSNSPKVIDLFAGAGLFGSAFKSEGFNLVRAVELDAVAAATYKANLGDHIIVGDIRTIVPSGRCDVLIAGPPCQGFSTLGKRDPKDARNTLSLEVVKWADKTSPKVVVIENVAAFLTSSMWRELTDALRMRGYSVRSYIFNAENFGVPQTRKRSFTVATFGFDAEIRPITTKNVKTVKEALADLPKLPDGKNHHSAPTPSHLALERMRLVPEGGGKKDIIKKAPHLVPKSWYKVEGEATDVWGRLWWNKPSNTLRTTLQNPSKGRYIHPEQNRVISLREAARLHSINDNWHFKGTPTQIARQIGNSVPPLLGRAIARSVRQLLS